MSNTNTTPVCNAPQDADLRDSSDRQAQAHLEGLLAKRHRKAAQRAARFGTTLTSARRDMRSNVVAWHEEAAERRIRTLPLPRGEDGSAPVVSKAVENLLLCLAGLGAVGVYLAHIGGWL